MKQIIKNIIEYMLGENWIICTNKSNLTEITVCRFHGTTEKVYDEVIKLGRKMLLNSGYKRKDFVNKDIIMRTESDGDEENIIAFHMKIKCPNRKHINITARKEGFIDTLDTTSMMP